MSGCSSAGRARRCGTPMIESYLSHEEMRVAPPDRSPDKATASQNALAPLRIDGAGAPMAVTGGSIAGPKSSRSPV
jgi:hypothetical protein